MFLIGIGIFGFIVYEISEVGGLVQFIIIIIALGIFFGIIWKTFSSKLSKQLTMFQAAIRIQKTFEKERGEMLIIDNTSKGTTKTFETNNKTYYGYIFALRDAPSVSIIVIWDTERNDIADFDYVPAGYRLTNPFEGFDPVKGRIGLPFQKPMPSRPIIDNAYLPIQLGSNQYQKGETEQGKEETKKKRWL